MHSLPQVSLKVRRSNNRAFFFLLNKRVVTTKLRSIHIYVCSAVITVLFPWAGTNMFTRSLRIIERTLKAFNSPIFYSFRLSAALLLKSFNSIQKSMWIYVLIKRLAIFDQAFQIYLNYFFLYIYFLYAL